jgi:rhodanese-related sulfurtransferase
MMKKYYLFLSILFAAFVLTSSCKDENVTPEPVINEAEVLVTYLETTDYVNTGLPSLITAADLNTANNLGDVYIVDIRSEADFNLGHISNAHNVTPANVFSHLEGVSNLNDYEKIAIVCYTGQTAGFYTGLLRIMGYTNAFSLKFGMASWHPDFSSKWTTNQSNTYHSQFTTTVTEKDVMGELPVLNTGKTTGEEILDARLTTVLTEGFDAAKITNATVFGNLSNYYIVNYWPANHYAAPGHIPGAIQYTPKETMKLAADLKKLPAGKEIVVYCYSGQTSAFLVGYLRLLGYNAKSLLFGTNGMILDDMVANGTMSGSIFTAPIEGYTYVTE